MKWIAYAFSGACVLLAIQIAVSAWALIKVTPDAKVHDVVTYVQLLVTFITAVLLAVFNYASTRSNEEYKAQLAQENAKALAHYQQQLGIETERSVERIRAEFATSVNLATAQFQSQLNQSSEDFKARLGQTIPQRYNGYHLMFKAMTKLFFAIRRLEEGLYPAEDLKAAFGAADDAAGAALLVDDDDRTQFYRYVTISYRIGERARSLSDPDAIIEVWEEEGKAYGAEYNRLENLFATKVRT